MVRTQKTLAIRLYIPSNKNIVAGQESHCLKIEAKYVLHEEAYETIIETWGLSEIYLVASQANAKYISTFPENKTLVLEP